MRRVASSTSTIVSGNGTDELVDFLEDDEDGPDGPTLEDVRRHGAGKGSRWPALLALLAILAVAAVVLWWSLLR